MKSRGFRIGIAIVAAFFLFVASGGTAFAWHGRACGYYGHYHGYDHWHHHADDYWSGLALGFGLGVIIPYLFSAPRAYNPPVAYAPVQQAYDPPVVYVPAPRPRQRILACEPKHIVEETRWDSRRQRYVLTREYFPERCWYEYR